MKIYFPIAKVDAERREVWGYASTEARDDQGEIVKREALVAALGDYMKFANIREMHQLSAVGVAKEAGVDDKGLYIGAKIVDDQAWVKVIEGVYKGYSIGGRITERDSADHKTITALVLNEISLVDRPANPEAVFDYWKAAGASTMPESRFNPPVQVWACGIPDHRHLGKAEALKCLDRQAALAEAGTAHVLGAVTGTSILLKKGEDPYGEVEYADPGYQPDGKKRYPIDTERHVRAAWSYFDRPKNAKKYTAEQRDKIKTKIIAAWRAMIDRDGPPSMDNGEKASRTALQKALWDVGRVAQIILDLDWLEEELTLEAVMEGDDLPQPERLRAIIAELCGFLNSLVAEETAEILDDADVGGEPFADADIIAMVAKTRGADLGRPEMHKLALAILAKAKHSRDDQALLDLAHDAAEKCMTSGGLSVDEREHMRHACTALKAAGAASTVAPGMDVKPPMFRPPAPEFRSRINATVDTSKAIDAIAAALAKRSKGHQALMDIAHECLGRLTDGQTCRAGKVGARHSMETMGHLDEAHGHLVEAGAACELPDRGEEEGQGTRFEFDKTFLPTDLAKALADERTEKAALIATLADLVPRLDRLAKRVDEIARTPLPPVTIAKSVTAVSKQQDGGAVAGAVSSDELAAAFAGMSKEEQTLTLIKASYARPIHPAGLPTAVASRES